MIDQDIKQEETDEEDLYFHTVEDVPFAQIRRECIENPDLSWKAKGILAYMLSRPPHWKIRYSDLVKRATDGATSLKSGIKELKEKGFLFRRVKYENNKISKSGYMVYSIPTTIEVAKLKLKEDNNGWKLFFSKDKKSVAVEPYKTSTGGFCTNTKPDSTKRTNTECTNSFCTNTKCTNTKPDSVMILNSNDSNSKDNQSKDNQLKDNEPILKVYKNILLSIDFPKSSQKEPSEFSDNRVEYSAETEIQNSGVNNTNQKNKEENTSNKNNIIISPDTTFLLKDKIPQSIIEKNQSSLMKECNSSISEKDKQSVSEKDNYSASKPVNRIGFTPQSITEGNSMPLPIRNTNSVQLPNEANILQVSEFRNKFTSESLKPEKKQKTITEPRMNDDVKNIINLWETLGLHKSKHTTNSFKEGVKAVYSLTNGMLFQDDSLMGRVDKRRYTIEDLELSIRRFAKAALDPNYLPEGKYKNTIKKYPLSTFLYNKYADKTKSLFIYYLENEPQLLNKSKGKLLEDKHTPITRRLRDYYLDTVMRGIDIKLSIEDENHFINGSKRLLNFYNRNGDRMLKMGMDEYYDLTEWLCEALSDKVGGKKDFNSSRVAPFWFDSDITFNRTFPDYLLRQNLYEGNDTCLSDSDDRDEDEDGSFLGARKNENGTYSYLSRTPVKEKEEDPAELIDQW